MKQYKYTLDNNLLSEEQRDFYETNGFLVVKKLVPSSDLKEYCDRFIEVCNKPTEIGYMRLMKDVSLKDRKDIEPERVVNKVQDFQADEVFSKYFKLPQVLKYVECFTGKDISAVHTMLINKPPDAGTQTSRHPLHQDLHYFPFRPADRIVCSWTAMQVVTRQNGCLVVVPGTHTKKLLPHSYPEWKNGVNAMYHGIQGYSPDDSLAYLEMEPGDTVFFHPILIHGSGRNKTEGFRKAISTHFATSHLHFIDVKGTSQENIAEEVLQLARKKLPGADFNFNQIMKFRQVVVQGVDPGLEMSKL